MQHRKSRMVLKRIILTLCIAGAAGGVGWASNTALGEWSEARIVAALKQGGHIIYLRHADRHSGARERFDENSSLKAFEDCATQRNLTREGREDARQIGDALRQWNVPIGRIIALPLCRTRETARLAFGPEIELDSKLYNVDHLRSIVSQVPTRGNTVIVATEDQVFQLVGTKLRPGEAAVFAPTFDSGFHYLGNLDQDDLDP